MKRCHVEIQPGSRRGINWRVHDDPDPRCANPVSVTTTLDGITTHYCTRHWNKARAGHDRVVARIRAITAALQNK